MDKTLVILAAGMGSRYGGLKQLDSIGPNGETIIEYSLFDSINAGFNHVVFIIREDFYEDFQKKIGSNIESKVRVSYVFQDLEQIPDGFEKPETREKPWGTGHALYCAGSVLNSPFLIINGDDFYGSEAFQKAADALEKQNSDDLFAGMIGYSLQNTLSENGSVSRGICSLEKDDSLKCVIETHGITKNDNAIICDSGQISPDSMTSMNLWYFSHLVLSHIENYFTAFLNEKISDISAEFYLPSIANNLIEREKLQIEVHHTSSLWYGVTYKKDKKSVCEAIMKMISDGLYPLNLWENK